MKKLFLVFSLGVVIFTSCKKEKEESSSIPLNVFSKKSVNSYFPLSNGSYWVYKQALYDNTGNNLLYTMLNDSVVVKNDTVIDGKTYHSVYNYNYLGTNGHRISYWRDSADYIIDNYGEIKFCVNTPGVVDTRDLGSYGYINYSCPNQLFSVNVPAGNFNDCADYQGEYFRSGDSNSPYLTHYFCKDGIGCVKQICLFGSDLRQLHFELISYHIQ